MFKSVLLTLILSVFFSTEVLAQDVDFSFGGQFRLRNDHKNLSNSGSDKQNTTQMRARMEFEAKVSDQLIFHIAPQGTKDYGEIQYVPNDASSNSEIQTSGDKYHSGVDLFEAYVLSKRDGFSYKIGRQALGYGDNVILGTRNWTAGGLVFDAVKFTKTIGQGELDIVYSQISEGDSTATTEDDTNLAFLYYKAIKSKEKEFDIYVIHNNEREVLETTNYGFRFVQQFESLSLRTENIYQVQLQTEKNEHNINLEIGYNFNDNFKSYLGFMQASAYYDHMYTNRHKYNGIIDIVGRKNLETINLGANYNASSDLSFTVDYLAFSQKETEVGAYNQATSRVIGGDAEEKNIGTEVDFFVNYKISKHEKLTFALSVFEYGDYFTDEPDNSTFGYLQYLVKI